MLEAGGALCNVYQLYQARGLHFRDIERSTRLHKEAIDLAKTQHEKDVLIMKQTYLMDVYVNLEQHFQQLNADLIASSKESERDMFDQRNQQYQTIILSCSVMFSALSTVIIQGYLPRASGSTIFILYAITTALSFSFLFLSIVLCIEIISRASKFMYKRAYFHTQQLSQAIDETKKMMRTIRKGTPAADTSTPTGKSRRHMMTRDFDITGEWDKHELVIHDILEKREAINDKAAMVAHTEDQEKLSFEQYWATHCKHWGEWAVFLFYCGSAALLFSIAIFMLAEFLYNYKSLSGAIVAVCLLGASFVLGLALIVYLRADSISGEGDPRYNIWNSLRGIGSNDSNSAAKRLVSDRWKDGASRVSRPTPAVPSNPPQMRRQSSDESESRSSDVESPAIPVTPITPVVPLPPPPLSLKKVKISVPPLNLSLGRSRSSGGAANYTSMAPPPEIS